MTDNKHDIGVAYAYIFVYQTVIAILSENLPRRKQQPEREKLGFEKAVSLGVEQIAEYPAMNSRFLK
jgi:hypothetical protein